MVNARIEKISVALRWGWCAGVVPVRRRKVMVIDEAAIPENFWRAAAPTLDKTELYRVLQADGAAVAGAMLSNPQPALSVRTK